MRETIIETGAMTRFDNVVDEVVGAGRNLSGFVLAYGQAGRGKSVAADRYHIQRGGAYVRVWQGWSQTSFLQRLLFEVRGKNMDMPRHTGNRCKELIVSLLEEKAERAIAACRGQVFVEGVLAADLELRLAFR